MKEITFICREQEIKAKFSVPQLARGIVVFSQSATTDQTRLLAQTFERGGIGYLYFDLPNESALPLLTEHLLAATRYIREQPELQEIPIGYLGIFDGALPAFCAAAIETSLKALVCLAATEEPTDSVIENITAPTLLLVGGKDEASQKISGSISDKLTCKKDLKPIGGAGAKLEEQGAIEITAMKTFNWFIVHFGGLKKPMH